MFKHLEVLVEEYSAEAALNNLLPKILPTEIEFKILSFRGKTDLLKKLPSRLKGYRSWIPEDWRILVLCDRDNEDCCKLKNQLENFAARSGFITKQNAADSQFTLINRIAVEELEAWLIGDANALTQAYPRVPLDFFKQQRYRIPDAIAGGTWEALEALLQRHRYHLGGLNEVEAAHNISQYMDPENNRSPSFKAFYAGLITLIAQT